MRGLTAFREDPVELVQLWAIYLAAQHRHLAVGAVAPIVLVAATDDLLGTHTRQSQTQGCSVASLRLIPRSDMMSSANVIRQ
jgi:hypothetical protein